MLVEEQDRELYESYSAQCLWDIARAIHGLAGAEYTTPQYVELIHPETKQPQKTAQEIKDDLVRQLLGG